MKNYAGYAGKTDKVVKGYTATLRRRRQLLWWQLLSR